jgi:hypothetical protein
VRGERRWSERENNVMKGRGGEKRKRETERDGGRKVRERTHE